MRVSCHIRTFACCLQQTRDLNANLVCSSPLCSSCSIIVAGDGRYYNTEAMQIICRVLAANGVADIWVPSTGIMSTPAVSAVIRTREGGTCKGGIILTASHNPGGPGEDFGIKYNLEYGQPAGEDFTDDVSWLDCNESALHIDSLVQTNSLTAVIAHPALRPKLGNQVLPDVGRY